jgi:hypothetical protein
VIRRLLPCALLLVACGGGDGGNSSANIPAVVSQVTAVVNNGTIELSWPPAAGAIGYNVYMASQAGVTRLNVNTLPGNMSHGNLQTSFDHPPGLDPNTTYYFVVTAENSAGQSAESCEVTAEIGSAQGGNC